jgi:O-antigen ligase
MKSAVLTGPAWSEKSIYGLWMAFSSFFILLALWMENWLPALVPVLTPVAIWVINDYRNLFYLFFAVVPFSIEYNFAPNLGMDIPSEPIMMLLFGIGLLLFFSKAFHGNFSNYRHPITAILLLHFVWILISSINSQFPIISAKVTLAKLWYIIPFYFFSLHVLKGNQDITRMTRYAVYMLAISIMIVLYRHYQKDFAFEDANFVVTPLFRNHVNYACIIVIFLPYLWALVMWSKVWSAKVIYLAMMGLYAVGIYFSYTRAAILSMVLAVVIYYIIKKRWMMHALMLASLALMLGIAYLMYNNNYLRFNPQYEKTISHQRFDKLLTATYKMEDISTMERLYRWVAGVQMIQDKPLMGFGPGTFYSSYGAYTVSSFQTYVSNNIDNSTVHNYFLLVFIEQGFIGFIIFILLCIIVLISGERTYHQLTRAEDKVAVMSAMLSFCIILLLNTINDMIETDKVGPFFFLAMAIIVVYRNRARNQTLGIEYKAATGK